MRGIFIDTGLETKSLKICHKNEILSCGNEINIFFTCPLCVAVGGIFIFCCRKLILVYYNQNVIPENQFEPYKKTSTSFVDHSCVCHAYPSVHCCLVVTGCERIDLVALVCDV